VPAVSLRIIALGTRMPRWVGEGFADYVGRLPREWAIELIELKAEKRATNRTAPQALALEASRIRLCWSPGYYKIALDERGCSLTTSQFARMLDKARERMGRIAFAIGSADGLDASLKDEADMVLALSSLTLPHGLVRVMLAEQLYRVVSLLRGHPYHRP